MQCETVFASHVGDPGYGIECQHPAGTECSDCGANICWNFCSDSCFECGLNFCNAFPNYNVTCLDQHVKETGHQVNLPSKHKAPNVPSFIDRVAAIVQRSEMAVRR
jgi:hypothetical protein